MIAFHPVVSNDDVLEIPRYCYKFIVRNFHFIRTGLWQQA